MNELIQADLLKWLRDNQWLVQNGYIPKAHAVMGDPPYGIEFMSKEWDKHATPQEFQAWVTEWATLLLDYVYPGAVLALFGGTRTYHRLAAGLEDAGWEVFDCMMYLYGSGFPKAADIGKLIDKSEGAERTDGARDWSGGMRSGGIMGVNHGTQTRVHRRSPASEAAAKWDGYKTALKPAYEPIVLARAPRGSTTYADLAQQYGTSALNIDGGRIASGEDYKDGGVRYSASAMPQMGGHQTRNWVQDRIANGQPVKETFAHEDGRYPANLALDEAAARMLDAQSGDCKAGSSKTGLEPSARTLNVYGKMQNEAWDGYGDNGGASRFFYTSKSPSWEREAGLADFDPTIVNDGRDTPIDNAYQRGDTKRRNTHPTVKPIQLCQWLSTLLLPPELDTPRRLLVPFAGSGSEMIGAQLAGWDEIVGIEREAEYCAINEARRRWWSRFQTYEQAQTAYRPVIEITDDFSNLPLFAAVSE